jgi:choline dehydrogenase-like flavoprotein
MANNIYDVAIVGTGAGGSTAARVLCEAGLNVVALNSGRKMNPAKDYGNHRRSYDLPFRGFLPPDKRDGRYICETEITQPLWEHEIPYTVAPGSRWIWARCNLTGGKANFWGRSSARFGEIDFKAATLDGVDVDWPISSDEIGPYYSRIERMIGVASSIQNRPSNPDGEYLTPFKFRCFDHILKKAADGLGVPYLPDRSAQLTVAYDGRPACHYCGGCTNGCETGSFFSPTWYHLPAAQKTGKFDLRVNAHVRSVLVSGDGRRATGVAYVDRNTKQEVEVRAKAVILAASCCETAKIMLNSKSRHHPHGIANSSGQLGRNLSDHLYATPAYGCLPQLVGGPSRADNVSEATTAWMPRWQNLDNPRAEKFIRGYSVYPYGGCAGFPHYWKHFDGFGTDFKRTIKRYYPAPVSFLIQAPSLPSPSNYLDLDPEVKDSFGIPVARFHFEWGQNELLMWEHGKETCQELIRRAGGEVWGSGDDPWSPGISLHETGPCRFGNDAKNFVTDRYAACHDVPNLYICDASIFPFATDKTSTLSIMAFALRSCEHLLEKLHRREL